MKNFILFFSALFGWGFFASAQTDVELKLLNDSTIVIGNDTIKAQSDTFYLVKEYPFIDKISSNLSSSKYPISICKENGEQIKANKEMKISLISPSELTKFKIDAIITIQWIAKSWNIAPKPKEPEEVQSENLPIESTLKFLDDGGIELRGKKYQKSEEDIFYWDKDIKDSIFNITGVVMPSGALKKQRLIITVNGDTVTNFSLKKSDQLKKSIPVSANDTLVATWNDKSLTIQPQPANNFLTNILVGLGILLLLVLGGLAWRNWGWLINRIKKGSKTNEPKEKEIKKDKRDVNVFSSLFDSFTYSTETPIKSREAIVAKISGTSNLIELDATPIKKDKTRIILSDSTHTVETIPLGEYKLTICYESENGQKITEITPFLIYGNTKKEDQPQSEIIKSDTQTCLEQQANALCGLASLLNIAPEALSAKIKQKDYSDFEEKFGTKSINPGDFPREHYLLENLRQALNIPFEYVCKKLETTKGAKELIDDYTKSLLEKVFKKHSTIKEIYEKYGADLVSFAYSLNQRLAYSNGGTPWDQEPSILLKALDTPNNSYYLYKFFFDKLREKGLSVGATSLTGYVEDMKKLQQKAEENTKQTDITANVITLFNKGEATSVLKNFLAKRILDKINEQVAEDRKLIGATEEEVFEQIVKAVNAPRDEADVEAIANALSSKKIEDVRKDAEAKILEAHNNADTQILEAKKEAEKQVGDALNRAERAEQSAKTNKENLEKKTKEFEENLENAKKEADERVKQQKEFDEAEMTKQRETLEKAKAESEAKLNQDKEEIRSLLNEEKEVHAADVQKLQDFLSAYIDMIKNTFEMVNNSIKVAYNGSDKDAPLAQFVSKKIVKNNIFSFDDFEESLQSVLASCQGKSVADVKDVLRTVFVTCLSEEMPTWIDVLARLYSYTKVPFIAEQFVKKGLDLACVGTAFQFTKHLLAQLDIEITCPELFVDTFNKNDYQAKALRNIDSYVEDINSHVTDENLIIDLFTVGFKVKGEVKEIPVVSKF